MATLAELEAREQQLRRELREIREDPTKAEQAATIGAELAYLDQEIERQKNSQSNSYTVQRVGATSWAVVDQSGRRVGLGRTPEEAVAEARASGAKAEDLARIQLPPPAVTRPQPPSGTWKIERDANTGLWVVLFDGINLKSLPGGNRLGRADEPINAINLAIQKVDQVNDPVTGVGPGSVPPLTAAVRQQLLDQAAAIEQQERQQFERSQQEQGPGTVSAGTTTAQAQTARDDGATTQNPEPVTAPGRITGTTNADQFEPQSDTGVNAQTRPGESVQSVPAATASVPISQASDPANAALVATAGRPPGSPSNPNTPPPAAVSDQPRATSATQRGEFNREDRAGATGGSGQNNSTQVLANRTAQAITPQANVLDAYSSYIYSISIYLMSPEDFRRLMQEGQRFLPGYLLLMQSGGAPTSSGITATPGVADVGETPGQGPSLTQGRNQFFPLDYYIDDLELKSVIAGKGTGLSHNVTEMQFKIIEPNGITLLSNLYRATAQYINQGGGAGATGANYSAQNYLMVIRWYGYDSQGNLLTQPTSTGSPRTDTNAITEKFIPFQFTSIKFKIANRLTEYECAAVCPQNNINTAQGRGVIPYNMQLTATTLQNLFNGNVSFTDQRSPNQDSRDTSDQRTATGPDKATVAPKPTLAVGLTQALNRYQEEMVKKGEYTIADQYEIRISHPEIANARVSVPGLPVDRPTRPNVQSQQAAEVKDGAKQSVQNDTKTTSVVSGTSIMQFIDLAVRSSTYVLDQQTKIIGRDKDGREIEIKQNSPAQAFAWYVVGVQATPIGNAQDPKRGDYAYKITYEIAPYGVNQIRSDYFPEGRFRGAQKRYAYWFTGENTSILNFEQDFNYLYYLTVNSNQNSSSMAPIDVRDIERRLFSPNSAETNQGQRYNVFEPGANAADFLYSPADLSRVKITIVGDPAWLAQGEVWRGVRGLVTQGNNASNEQDPYFSPFLPDGTINFDAREALFEVSFNRPADYNLQTGLVDVQRFQ